MTAAWCYTLQQVRTLLSPLQVICMSNLSNFCWSLIHILDAAYSCALWMWCFYGQQQREPCWCPVPSSFYIALLAVWCQPKSLQSEEFCKEEELKKSRTTPLLLGYAPPFHTSTIYLCFTIAWGSHTWTSFHLISSNTLPPCFSAKDIQASWGNAQSMFIYPPPWGMEIWTCTFLLITDV